MILIDEKNSLLKFRAVQGAKRDNKRKKQTNIAPLQPLTLAAIKPWGIRWELVVPVCQRKISKGIANLIIEINRFAE